MSGAFRLADRCSPAWAVTATSTMMSAAWIATLAAAPVAALLAEPLAPRRGSRRDSMSVESMPEPPKGRR